MKRARGFTLLELLVAVGIFGVVSALSYGGLQTVLTARVETERQTARLAELQGVLLFLERDLAQALARPVRDALGDPLPALSGGDAGVELTRAGWANPAGRPRGTAQRVAWAMDGESLVRMSWPVLDRTQDGEPYRAALLQQVESLGLRYLGPQREWVESWPPAGSQDRGELPLALEVTLELADWGEITRILPLP